MPIPILRPTQVSPEEANPFASGLSKLIQNIGPAMAQHQKLQQQQAMQALSGYAPAHPTALMQNLRAAGFDPDTEQYQTAARSYLERGMVPTSIKQARYAAPLAQDIINHAEEQGFIDATKKYSTIGGRGLEALSGISGALGFGAQDQDYIKYQTFVNTTIPQLVAETRKLLGENASVRQTELLEKAVDPGSWRAGPELVQSRWDELKTLHDFAQKQVERSPLGSTAQEKNVPRGPQSKQQPQYSVEALIAERDRRRKGGGGS
jgi:hypothetical protein